MCEFRDHFPISVIHSVEQATYLIHNQEKDPDHAGRLAEIERLQAYVGEIVFAMLQKELWLIYRS